MKPTDPLVERWQKTVARKHDSAAILATSGEALRTFGDIEERARELLERLDTFGEGDVLAVQIGNHADWPAILIACLRRRVVVLPIEQSLSNQQRDEVFEICGAKAVISAAGSGASPETVCLETANGSPSWGKNPPSLLKLTSGTTAAPRAIRFGSRQLLADCDQICETMEIHDDDLNFGVIPMSHSYGFSNLLTPLVARGVSMVISRDRTPRAILADLARCNATVFPGMPVFYQAFCEMAQVPKLSTLRLCISAGAPLSIAIAKRFQEKYGLRIHSFYGASECGGICYDRDAISQAEGFVGKAMRGVSLEMVDSKASVTQVRVRSNAAGDGYFPVPDKEKLNEGIFIPDDLLAADGCGFRIVGRTSDVINVAGKKVNPAEVEAHLLNFVGVQQAIVFGRPAGAGLRNEEVAACVVAAPDISEIDLLQFCRAALSTWQVPKRIFIVEKIPANERGKINRRELSRQFSINLERSPLP